MNRLSASLDRLRRTPSGPVEGLGDLYVAAVVALLPMIVVARALLPDRYSYDSNTIASIARREYHPFEDTSYLYVGRLYEFLGAADRPWLAALIGSSFAAMALYPALLGARGPVTLRAGFLVGLYVVTVSAYLGQYSKEVWVLPVVFVVLVAGRGLRGELAIVAAALTYAYFFRTYWALILVVYVGLRIVTSSALRRRRVVGSVVGVVVGVTVLAPVALGESIQTYRQSVNLDRVLNPDATTLIAPPELGANPIADSIENVVALVELAVPVPLAALGSPQYLVFAVVIVAMWALFARSAVWGPGRLLDGGPARDADPKLLRAALFAIAVLTTQCLFEPDYGSYLKHLTPVMPLLIAVALRSASRPAADARAEAARPAPGSVGSARE
ncbi:hypothetical protein [Blastococcus haudaquaticus]|uniref:Dolichyl-phosphate-mannose-protein mannosyltransferase n=1 Tax=Blastococcus haudaquaticus TaxID=1938745 RepID=A0A286GZ91_9ACTN|nr:hypothetical protein [Blastococcus haudaquaticus]SOE00419.1 hypothetical protein SAMN06272739_2584 [Blastococcus haudaquaticus]